MDYDSPIYDPIFERASENYYPANEPTLRLVLIGQIYRDIQHLYELIQEMPSEYRRRLLTKYAVIEWLSMDEHFRRLFNEVSHGKTGYTLSDGQSKSLRTKRKTYFQASKEFQRAFKVIQLLDWEESSLRSDREPSNVFQ